MTPEAARNSLIDLISQQNYEHDTERHHEDADEILCKLLSHLGYDDIVNLYCQIDKWYA